MSEKTIWRKAPWISTREEEGLTWGKLKELLKDFPDDGFVEVWVNGAGPPDSLDIWSHDGVETAVLFSSY